MNTISVSGLPKEALNSEVTALFEKPCGVVKQVELHRSEEGVSCTVRFEEQAGFEKAIELKDTFELKGQKLKIFFLKTNPKAQDEPSWNNQEDSGHGWKNNTDWQSGGAGQNWWKDSSNWWDGGGKDWKEGGSSGSRWGKSDNRAATDEDVTKRIWVGGLPTDVSEEDLKKLFGDYGPIAKIRIVHKERDTYAFIDLPDSKMCQKAIDEVNSSKALGPVMRVNWAKRYGEPPPNREQRGGWEERDQREGQSWKRQWQRSRSRDKSRSRLARPDRGSRDRKESRERDRHGGRSQDSRRERHRVSLRQRDEEDDRRRGRESDRRDDRRGYDRRREEEDRRERERRREPEKEESEGSSSSSSSDSDAKESESEEKKADSESEDEEEEVQLVSVSQPKKRGTAEAFGGSSSSTAAPKTQRSEAAAAALEGKQASGSATRKVAAPLVPEPAGSAVPAATPKRQNSAEVGVEQAFEASSIPRKPKKQPEKAAPAAAAARKPPPVTAAANGSSKAAEDSHPAKKRRPESKRAEVAPPPPPGPAVGPPPAPAGKTGSLTIRVENLPGDMTLEELRRTACDFGEVVEVKLWKTNDGSKTSIVQFDTGTDVQRVVKKLDKRRVEGWDRRLSASIVEP